MALDDPNAVLDPVHGVEMVFSRDDADHLWVESALSDGGHLPEHFHPTLEERWEVLEGTAELKLDGEWRQLTPADGVVTVAPLARHELRNRSGRTARLRTEVIPPGRLQEFLTDAARAARAGLISPRDNPRGLRGVAWISEFAVRHSDETVMCSPPPAVQRAVLPTLARLTRRLRPEL